MHLVLVGDGLRQARDVLLQLAHRLIATPDDEDLVRVHARWALNGELAEVFQN